MDKVKAIVNSSWFKAALLGGAALALTFTGNWFYVGIALGAGIREFLLGLKA
jgi:hypothetical protein|tara:strand:+ start:298 stop:453 length:156 start_codon:yes stop_codon:yes gene_type:complete